MGKEIKKPRPRMLNEVEAAIAFAQPKLRAEPEGDGVRVSGRYLLLEDGTVATPSGPISEFDIEMRLPSRFPVEEPQVFEVGKRIPQKDDRHISWDGTCCVTVWEQWLVSTRDHSFAAFLNGPLYQFFLGQYWFEKTGKWPFGEHSHGKKGLEEAYAEALGGVPARKLRYYLRLLSKNWPKGHWQCPCGSGRRLRVCHKDDLAALHQRLAPHLARRMLKRLKNSPA